MLPNEPEEAAGAHLIEEGATGEIQQFIRDTGHSCPFCLTHPRILYQTTREVYAAITLATAMAGAEAWQRTGSFLEDLRKELNDCKRIMMEHDAAFERWRGKSPRHGTNHHPAQMEGQIND